MTTARVRAGDSDRQSAVDLLTAHYTDGRLTVGEYDERVGKAYAAVHLDDLPQLFEDLPGGFGGLGGGDKATGSRGPRGPWAPPDVPPWMAGSSAAPPWARGPKGRGFAGPGRTPVRRSPVAVVATALVAVLAVFTVLAFIGLFFWPLVWVAIAILVFSRGGCARRRTGADRARSSRGPGW